MFSLYSRCFSIWGCHSLVLHFWPLRDTLGGGLGGCRTRGNWSWRLQCRREGVVIRSLQTGEVVEVEVVEVSSYRPGAWLRLWGWSCSRFCCSCTASCCDWSDVESLLINADTQFAGMISPAREGAEVEIQKSSSWINTHGQLKQEEQASARPKAVASVVLLNSSSLLDSQEVNIFSQMVV